MGQSYQRLPTTIKLGHYQRSMLKEELRMAGKKPTKLKAPDICPVCGEDVPRGALACPECGADHNSGWREDADTYDAVDLPDEDFNYHNFIDKEFGSAPKPAGVKPFGGLLLSFSSLFLWSFIFYAAH